MESPYGQKGLSTVHISTAHNSGHKMIAASSRPARALLILLVIVLIYIFQPFTAGHYNLPGRKSSSPPDPNWPKASEKAFASGDAPEANSDALAETTEGGPRIRKATMIYDSDKFNSVYERSVDTHINHGKQWNSPVHLLRHDVVDAGFFNKPAFLLGIVIQEMAKPYGQRADWVVWFDADTMILNPNVPWSIFLPPADFEEIHLLASKDHNGFNAGMMILRVHEWTVKMLSEVLALRQLRPEVEYLFYDQGATKWVIERPGYEEHVLYQPHDWWNAFGLEGEPYATDRFLLHFAGVDCCGQPEKKTTVMGRWLDIVENHPELHTTPLANTTYPKSVEDYWKRLKDAKKLQAQVDKLIEGGGSKPAGLNKALGELNDVIVREADSADKLNEAIKKVRELFPKTEAKPEAAKPAEEKKTPPAEEKKTPPAEEKKAPPAEEKKDQGKQNRAR